MHTVQPLSCNNHVNTSCTVQPLSCNNSHCPATTTSTLHKHRPATDLQQPRQHFNTSYTLSSHCPATITSTLHTHRQAIVLQQPRQHVNPSTLHTHRQAIFLQQPRRQFIHTVQPLSCNNHVSTSYAPSSHCDATTTSTLHTLSSHCPATTTSTLQLTYDFLTAINSNLPPISCTVSEI